MNKTVHKAIGAIVFLFSAIVLFLTVQPSVSFWDCGELSAASYGLQVTHPPGAPFFILVNHIFSLIPFAENIGFRINSLTVIASSFSVLFLYLVAVKLINNLKNLKVAKTPEIVTYISAATGALSMCFATAYWFNSTESNVFGFSTLLFTLMIWLLMIWYEKAEQPGSEKYLLLIAFILGLSPGVHLMSVLAAVPAGMIVVIRKFSNNDEITKESGKIFLINIAVLLIAAALLWASQTSSTPPEPAEYRAFDRKFMGIMAAITVVIIYLTRKKTFNINSFYLIFGVGFIANLLIYPGIVKYLPTLIVSIGGNNIFSNVLIFSLILLLLGYLSYWSFKNKRPVINLVSGSFLFIIIGFSIYTIVIIRANANPPMNEDNPKDIERLVSYVSREQYGEFPIYKRRYSQEPQHQQVWNAYSSDLDYFWRWQMNHMYIRYLLWEYVGRESWDQDAGVKFSQLYAVPFIIGLFGLAFHFRRDWKLASVFLTIFIFMGFLICFYQNQQQMQPRDREYFYAGSWFVFSIWIAIGIQSLAAVIRQKINKNSAREIATYGFLAIIFLFIPLNMLRTNFHQEDRSENWVPWDYAYNLLQSCSPNSVLFTCGDNDTFPLWYLQDVEGIRRDIRIANLSLLNTEWYIKQLKNDTPYGSMKVPISYSDAQIDKLMPVQWQDQFVEIPVTKQEAGQMGVTDSTVLAAGKIRWHLAPTINNGNVKAIRVQDMMIKDIILANKWQRPIYFAATCQEDSKIGLEDYLKLEGLAYRLVPQKSETIENVSTDIAWKNMFAENITPNKSYQPGFLIRSFSDPSVFLDENQIRTTYTYRSSYMSLANYYLQKEKNPQMCLNTLNELNKKIPYELVPMDYRSLFSLSNLYYTAGDLNTFRTMAGKIEEDALKVLNEHPRVSMNNYFNPYTILKLTYEYLGEYDKEIEILQRMQSMGANSADIQNEILRIEKLKDSLQLKK